MEFHRTLTNGAAASSDWTPRPGVKRKGAAALLFLIVVAALPLPATANEETIYVWCLYQGRTNAYPGPNGLRAVFSDVFRMKQGDYSRYTNDEANSFESYVDTHFDFHGGTTVTCHPSESYQAAYDKRNNEISSFRRGGDHSVYSVDWSYRGR